MTTPDWRTANSEATHWDTAADVFCKADAYYSFTRNEWKKCYHVDWGTNRYTARPLVDMARLKVDAKYWDEVAPEGATHLIDGERFAKWVDGRE
jgi:hypothetical protein